MKCDILTLRISMGVFFVATIFIAFWLGGRTIHKQSYTLPSHTCHNRFNMVANHPSKCYSCERQIAEGFPTKCFDCEKQQSQAHWQASYGSPRLFAGLT